MLALILAATLCPQVWACRAYHAHTHAPIRRRDALVCFAHATGQRYPRRGYVVDHIKPLACGGCDEPRNMQWQTAAAGKAKDRTERTPCK
jgi:hypothetical protein